MRAERSGTPVMCGAELRSGVFILLLGLLLCGITRALWDRPPSDGVDARMVRRVQPLVATTLWRLSPRNLAPGPGVRGLRGVLGPAFGDGVRSRASPTLQIVAGLLVALIAGCGGGSGSDATYSATKFSACLTTRDMLRRRWTRAPRRSATSTRSIVSPARQLARTEQFRPLVTTRYQTPRRCTSSSSRTPIRGNAAASKRMRARKHRDHAPALRARYPEQLTHGVGLIAQLRRQHTRPNASARATCDGLQMGGYTFAPP